ATQAPKSDRLRNVGAPLRWTMCPGGEVLFEPVHPAPIRGPSARAPNDPASDDGSASRKAPERCLASRTPRSANHVPGRGKRPRPSGASAGTSNRRPRYAAGPMAPTLPRRISPPERLFSGYIFDCDGTLADTMPLHHLAWQRALAEQGATFSFDWDLFVSRAGMTLEQTVVELAAQFSVPLDPVATARAQRLHYA